MFQNILALAEPALRANTAKGASRAFHSAARRMGATYLQTRVYRRPPMRLTAMSHWNAGGFVERIAAPGWEGSPGFNYICFENVPTVRAIEEGRTRYRFGEFAPHGDKRFGTYWEAFSEAGIAEMLCSTAYGAGRATASLHLGFAHRDFSDAEAMAIQTAGMVLVERLMSFGVEGEEPAAALLTPRENDVMAFVAEGKTDWEIATILGISETTARSHADNARRKLGAVNRAHAVARFLAGGAMGLPPARG